MIDQKSLPRLIQSGLFVGNRSGHNLGVNWAKIRGLSRVQQVLMAEATPKGVAANGPRDANMAPVPWLAAANRHGMPHLATA